MTESQLLGLLAGAYEAVSAPVECAAVFDTVKKMIVRLGHVDNASDPPVIDVYNVVYYVKDSGLETEEAYIAPADSRPEAFAEIGAAYTAAVAGGTIVKKITP